MFDLLKASGQRIPALVVGLVLAFTATAASAVTITFDRITSNSSADAAAQLVLDVTDDAGNNRALMAFSVVTGPNPDANIHEIYFSDLGSIFVPPPTVVSTTGTVSFVTGSANPGDLPSGGNATPPFTVTAGLLADIASGRGGSGNGVTVGESITLGLTYSGGSGFSNLLAALTNGDFRAALHVGSLLAGASDSFVSSPYNGGGGVTPPVPLPAGLPLLLTAFGLVAVVRRKARKPV
jgi:hypothetical protein